MVYKLYSYFGPEIEISLIIQHAIYDIIEMVSLCIVSLSSCYPSLMHV